MSRITLSIFLIACSVTGWAATTTNECKSYTEDFNICLTINDCQSEHRTPFLIAIGGGSGSGKSTIVKMVQEQCADQVLILSLDNYYRDLSHLSLEEREASNYDHPASIDSELLLEHLQRLLKGQTILRPTYDFATHSRIQDGHVPVVPKPTIILDGIFALSFPEIRDLTELKVFMEVDEDLRFIRRLQRDLSERGRTVPSVIHQYLETVRPMHLEHIEPTKKHADILVFWEKKNDGAVKMLVSRIKEHHRDEE